MFEKILFPLDGPEWEAKVLPHVEDMAEVDFISLLEEAEREYGKETFGMLRHINYKKRRAIVLLSEMAFKMGVKIGCDEATAMLENMERDICSNGKNLQNT